MFCFAARHHAATGRGCFGEAEQNKKIRIKTTGPLGVHFYARVVGRELVCLVKVVARARGRRGRMQLSAFVGRPRRVQPLVPDFIRA